MFLQFPGVNLFGKVMVSVSHLCHIQIFGTAGGHFDSPLDFR